MRILIITNKPEVDHINLNLLHLFGTARDLFASEDLDNGKCDVVAIGSDLHTFSANIAKYNAVNQVINFNIANNLVENIAPHLAETIKNYTHVLVAADSFGKNLLPRIAGILEVQQVSEIVKIINTNTFKKFMYAGNVLVDLEVLCPLKLLTVRTNSFRTNEEISDISANIIDLENNYPVNSSVRLLSTEIIDSIDLTNAKVIVTGGRSLGSRESFDDLIRPLAHKLNAGVGATRAAVDAGFAHNDCQIGQTGKIVAPNIYIAIGISGAVQHIAGMKDSKTVIAINHDENAPIFEHSDYGLITDLFEFIPEITNKI